MQKQLLLPRKCRLAGYIVLPFAIALLIAGVYYDYSVPFLRYHMTKSNTENHLFAPEFILNKDFYGDFTVTVAMIITFISLFMIAFSRMKTEDEYVSFIRLHALQISVYINYIILFITSLTLFGFTFLMIMQINLFTILVLFILIFNYSIYLKPRLSKS